MTLEDLIQKVAQLEAQNETLAAKLEELGGQSADETLAKAVANLEAKVVSLESSEPVAQNSVEVNDRKSRKAKVPKKSFKIGKDEYRFTVAKVNIGGQTQTTESLVNGPKEVLAKIVETYPGIVEKV